MKSFFYLPLTLMFFLGHISTVMGQVTYTYPGPPANVVFDGDLIEADYWDTIPRILSAGLGFSDIVSLDTNVLDQGSVLRAGGAWLSDITCGSANQDLTSTSLKSMVQNTKCICRDDHSRFARLGRGRRG